MDLFLVTISRFDFPCLLLIKSYLHEVHNENVLKYVWRKIIDFIAGQQPTR